MRSAFKVCFSGRTKLLARGKWGKGYKRIDEITVDDEVASRDENDPNGAMVWKKVEELFVRSGFLLNVNIQGRIIETTAEHPFYEYAKGWIEAAKLEANDRVRTDNGWERVDEVYDTGVYETVYNLRVADYHTYFVGDEDWGFSVWAHNQYLNNNPDDVAAVTRRAGLRLEQRDGKWVTITTNSRGQEVVRSATGKYDFVTVNGQTRVLRSGDPISTHTALAGNGPVDYAGQIVFSGRSNRGQIRSWDNGSGHFTPGSADAANAGLPMNLFRPLPGT